MSQRLFVNKLYKIAGASRKVNFLIKLGFSKSADHQAPMCRAISDSKISKPI